MTDIYEIEVDDISLKGKQKKGKSRNLFCYWKVREFGTSLTDLGRRLGIRVGGVG